MKHQPCRRLRRKAAALQRQAQRHPDQHPLCSVCRIRPAVLCRGFGGGPLPRYRLRAPGVCAECAGITTTTAKEQQC